MYIKQFNIKLFRVFDEISLLFNKGVNIIIGENNSGKTTIIDALRICPDYGKSDTNIYIQESICISIRLQAYRAEYTSCARASSKTKKRLFQVAFLRMRQDSKPRPCVTRQVF